MQRRVNRRLTFKSRVVGKCYRMCKSIYAGHTQYDQNNVKMSRTLQTFDNVFFSRNREPSGFMLYILRIS